MSELVAAFENYLINVKQASANTVASYMRDVRQFEQYVISQLDGDLLAVTHEQVLEYTNWMSDQGKSAASICRGVASIKNLYTYAVLCGSLKDRAMCQPGHISGINGKTDRAQAEPHALRAAPPADGLPVDEVFHCHGLLFHGQINL